MTGLENVTAIRRKNRPVPVMAQTVKGGAEFLSFPEIEKTGVVRHLMSTRLGGVSERGSVVHERKLFQRGQEGKCG